MEIENAQYTVNMMSGDNNAVSFTSGGLSYSVPLDPNNTHYAEILKQVEAGTLTIADAE
tara:strand:- start:327 stop:503 length:177 start_codon:yes stop_codon:yes gene_type:complete